MRDYKTLLDRCFRYVQDDYTQLWVFAGMVADAYPDISLEENCQMTKAIVKELMEKRGIKVIDQSTERPIEASTLAVLQQIEKVYEVGTLPDIGDGPWFG